jgi:hypothetical protein
MATSEDEPESELEVRESGTEVNRSQLKMSERDTSELEMLEDSMARGKTKRRVDNKKGPEKQPTKKASPSCNDRHRQ